MSFNEQSKWQMTDDIRQPGLILIHKNIPYLEMENTVVRSQMAADIYKHEIMSDVSDLIMSETRHAKFFSWAVVHYY